jgi:hypothetical protein
MALAPALGPAIVLPPHGLPYHYATIAAHKFVERISDPYPACPHIHQQPAGTICADVNPDVASLTSDEKYWIVQRSSLTLFSNEFQSLTLRRSRSCSLFASFIINIPFLEQPEPSSSSLAKTPTITQLLQSCLKILEFKDRVCH